ncbi:hypothetical protein LINPERHAP2_LOCUS32684, partial [Linum perenne]
THQHTSLAFEFQELCLRQWNIKFTHVYREANFAMDYLANLGHSLNFGLHLFFVSDFLLCSWLRHDLVGGLPQD